MNELNEAKEYLKSRGINIVLSSDFKTEKLKKEQTTMLDVIKKSGNVKKQKDSK